MEGLPAASFLAVGTIVEGPEVVRRSLQVGGSEVR